MRKLLLVTVLLFVSLSIVGCAGTIAKQSPQTNNKTKIANYKKYNHLYVFNKEALEHLLHKKSLSKFEHQTLTDFAILGLISKDGGKTGGWDNLEELRKSNLSYFKLNKMTYITITKTHNGYALVKEISYEKRNTAIIVYYSNDLIIEKIVVFPHNAERTIISDGADYVAVKGLDKVFNLKTYQAISPIKNLEKYDTAKDSISANNSYLIFSNKNEFWIKDLKTGKIRLQEKVPSKRHTAIHNDSVYYTIGNKDILLNIKSVKESCSNILATDDVKHVIWKEGSDTIYVIDKRSIHPILFKNNKCIKMKPYRHMITLLLDRLDYETRITSDNDNLMVISTLNNNFKIHKAELKKYTQEDIAITLGLAKAETLLNSGFESRGLTILDKLATDHYECNSATVLKTEKYRWAYVSYLASKQFNKRITKANEVDKNLMKSYRTFTGLSTWYGYENLIPEIQKRLKKVVKTKALYNQDEVTEHIAVNDAIYLLSIDKDNEAYDILFEHQPFSDYTKGYITNVAVCSSAFTKDTAKLAVATDIPKEKFDPSDCQKYDKHPFFFDIDGNKVFKGEEPKKSKPKKKVTKTNKDDAIELLN